MDCYNNTARAEGLSIDRQSQKSRNAARRIRPGMVLSIVAVLMLGLLLAFVAAPTAYAAGGGSADIAQDSADHGCDPHAAERGPGDECCDDDASASSGGDKCCDDASASNGGNNCCDDASASNGGDDCDEDRCDDASAAHGGDDDDCPIECPTPPVGAAHGGNDDDYACETEDAYARIVSMPADAAPGDWQIGEVTYTVTTTTVLDEDYGAFAVGKCVEVTWPISYPTFALEVETKPEHKCGRPEGETEIFGALTALPDDPSLLGVWRVADITFTVNATTEIESRLEAFEIGTFIKAELKLVDGVLVAREVKAIWGNHDGDWGWWKWRKGRAFGPIETLPVSGTVGSWVIAGVAYSVTEHTRLDDSDGPLVVGANVKVEFWKTRAGDRIAHKIKATDDTGEGNGQFRFVGVVDAKPEAFVGDWTIGGAPFVADANTTFDESRGLLVVDAYVSVRYVITDNMRLMSEIKTVVPPGGGHHHRFGRIDRRGSSMSMGVMAADGVAANTWSIGGVEYVITPATLLNDDLSALVEGGFAAVNAYTEADGTLVATSIEGVDQVVHQFLPLLNSQ